MSVNAADLTEDEARPAVDLHSSCDDAVTGKLQTHTHGHHTNAHAYLMETVQSVGASRSRCGICSSSTSSMESTTAAHEVTGQQQTHTHGHHTTVKR